MDFLSDPPARERKTAAKVSHEVLSDLVARAAIESARHKTESLQSALGLIGALRPRFSLDRGALPWLSDKLRDDADDIMTDLDNAQNALSGDELYSDSVERFVDYINFPEAAE